jgi:hypothetical protein
MDWGIWAHMGSNPFLLGKPARVSLAQACQAEMGCAWFRSLVGVKGSSSSRLQKMRFKRQVGHKKKQGRWQMLPTIIVAERELGSAALL